MNFFFCEGSTSCASGLVGWWDFSENQGTVLHDRAGGAGPMTRSGGATWGNDTTGEPFRHWDEDGVVDPECSNCHSSQGAAYYFANGSLISEEQYTPYTMGISAGLACEVCHQAPFAATGDEPALRPVASVTFPSGVAIADPELAADSSTLCMTCHQGRASKSDVDAAQPGSDAQGEYYSARIEYEKRLGIRRSPFDRILVSFLRLSACGGPCGSRGHYRRAPDALHQRLWGGVRRGLINLIPDSNQREAGDLPVLCHSPAGVFKGLVLDPFMNGTGVAEERFPVPGLDDETEMGGKNTIPGGDEH